MLTKITFTYAALEEATGKQQRSVLRLAAGETVEEVFVQKGGFDLPEGYLAFRQTSKGDRSIYGGIDRDGAVST